MGMTYPSLLHVACLDSHNTSYFYKREDGTYYWLHCRKNKDDFEVDVDPVSYTHLTLPTNREV